MPHAEGLARSRDLSSALAGPTGPGVMEDGQPHRGHWLTASDPLSRWDRWTAFTDTRLSWPGSKPERAKTRPVEEIAATVTGRATATVVVPPGLGPRDARAWGTHG